MPSNLNKIFTNSFTDGISIRRKAIIVVPKIDNTNNFLLEKNSIKPPQKIRAMIAALESVSIVIRRLFSNRKERSIFLEGVLNLSWKNNPNIILEVITIINPTTLGLSVNPANLARIPFPIKKLNPELTNSAYILRLITNCASIIIIK